MGRLSGYALSRLIGNPVALTTVPQLLSWPMWFAMFFDDPFGSVDPLAVEVGSGSMARPDAPPWTAYDVAGGVNSLEVAFEAIPPGTHVAAIGVMDAEVNGHLVAADLLHNPITGAPTPLDFPAGGTWILPAGQFYLGFDLTGLSP